MSRREDFIDVVMTTYNGADFLDEQIQSLLSQTHRRFRLLVRDDGSSDGTRAVLARYAARHSDVVTLIDDERTNLGPCASFSRLLGRCDAAYVMLCDQDDVWLPDKMAVTLDAVKRLEAACGPQCPIMVHTDLAVVDAALQPLARSYWDYQGLDPVRGGRLSRLLVQNVATGCASMVNRALLEKALPIPSDALMHDWWLALVAATLGRLEPIHRATALYRQHNHNRVGVQRSTARYVVRNALNLRGKQGPAEQLRRSQRQAEALLARYGPELPPAERVAIQAYASLHDRNPLARRWTLLRYGLLKQGLVRNLGLFAAI